MTMFNVFYNQFMYNELFFHDGETGQIIVPVLRPGNSHSNKWFVGILRRVVERILERYPHMKIYIRADSGFSCAPFYELAEEYNLFYAIGLASNNILKHRVAIAQKEVLYILVIIKILHYHFISFSYIY